MTNFETHLVGTADLLKRLRSDTPNMTIGHAAMRHAADRIEQLAAALTRANAATAAAYEVAARAINDRGAVEQENFGLDRATQNFFRARDMVRALATPDQTAALDRLIAEAEARTVERIAELVSGWRNTTPMTGEECANAILYASKKGGV